MTVRSRVARLGRRRRDTDTAIESLAEDLRALQRQVQQLQERLHALADSHDDLKARQLEEYDAIRTAVTAATDDLASRIDALHEARRGDRG